MSERQLSARPLLIMSVGIAALVGVTAFLQRIQDVHNDGRTGTVSVSRQEQDVSDLCSKAINAIHRNDRSAELDALEQIARKPLDFRPNVVGQGALKDNSPATLMTQLGRALRDQAIREALEGSPERSRTGIVECRRLSEHLLNAPKPSLSSLTLAHCLDQLANEAQVSAFPFDQKPSADEILFWRTSIIANIKEWRNKWDIKQERSPEHEASESELAARLTARYRYFRATRSNRTTVITVTPAPLKTPRSSAGTG